MQTMLSFFIICFNEFTPTTCLSYQYQHKKVPSLVFEKTHHISDSVFLNAILKISCDSPLFPVARIIPPLCATSLSRRFFISLSTIFSAYSLPFGSFFITDHSFISSLRFPCQLLQKYNITSKDTFVVVLLAYLYRKHYSDKVLA